MKSQAPKWPAVDGRGSRLRNRAAAVAFCGVVLLAPVPRGSDDVRSVEILLVSLGVLLAFSPNVWVSGWRALYLGLALGLVAAYGLIAACQIAPWGPLASPVWAKASSLLGEHLAATLSPDVDRTATAFGTPLLYLLAFAAGLSAARLGRSEIHFAKLFATAITLYAAYGMVAHFWFPKYVFWQLKEAHIGDLTGTFLNRNTEAAFLGMGLIFVAATFLDERRKLARGDDDSIIGRFTPDVRAFAVVAAMQFGVLAVALVMTHSRAGIFLTLFSLTLTGFVEFALRRGGARRQRRIKSLGLATLASVIAFAAMCAVASVGIELRLQDQGFEDAERMADYRGSLEMICEHPLTGMGIGAFGLAFPAYRQANASVLGIWERAHSSLIEVAAEAGAPFAAAMVAVWFLFTFKLLSRSIRFPSQTMALVAGIVLLQSGLHSLVDYPLQIPGLGVVVVMVVGLGIGETAPSSPRGRATASVAPSSPPAERRRTAESAASTSDDRSDKPMI